MHVLHNVGKNFSHFVGFPPLWVAPFPVLSTPWFPPPALSSRGGLFHRLPGRLGNGERGNKAHGSWGEGKQKCAVDTSPLPRFFNFPVFFLFSCFLAVSPLKEPLRRREHLLFFPHPLPSATRIKKCIQYIAKNLINVTQFSSSVCYLPVCPSQWHSLSTKNTPGKIDCVVTNQSDLSLSGSLSTLWLFVVTRSCSHWLQSAFQKCFWGSLFY